LATTLYYVRATGVEWTPGESLDNIILLNTLQLTSIRATSDQRPEVILES